MKGEKRRRGQSSLGGLGKGTKEERKQEGRKDGGKKGGKEGREEKEGKGKGRRREGRTERKVKRKEFVYCLGYTCRGIMEEIISRPDV